MFALKTLVPLALVALASASPLDRRQSSTTCGNTYYSAGQVSNAANAACNYVSDGSTAGGSTYPHQYNNYEGFNFPVDGPYYEFPIKSSGTYNGGSPGADRVVINDNCQYAGAITHTGASGNDFVGCSGTN